MSPVPPAHRAARCSPIEIELVEGQTEGIDLSTHLDWDAKPNPRHGRTFNLVRSTVKPLLRSARSAWLRRQLGSRFLVDAELVTERHHTAYGSPWCIGREQFDYLVSRGLERHHKVADLGCGPARTGIWIVEYLDAGGYFGIDSHRKSLEAAVQYELPLHGLEGKAPRFLNNAVFALDHFGVRFDWILSFSLFMHLDAEATELALRKVAASLAPGGKFVVNHRPPLAPEELLLRHGLQVEHMADYPCRFLEQGTGWVEMVRAIPS